MTDKMRTFTMMKAMIDLVAEDTEGNGDTGPEAAIRFCTWAGDEITAMAKEMLADKSFFDMCCAQNLEDHIFPRYGFMDDSDEAFMMRLAYLFNPNDTVWSHKQWKDCMKIITKYGERFLKV